jgi:hypothetical protein
MNRSGSVAFGTGWAMGADNEWYDWIFQEFNKQEYKRREGSKNLFWMSRRAAASGRITATLLGKFVTGTYVGKFEGVNVFESKKFGSYLEGYSGVTIPEKGIFIGLNLYKEGEYNKDEFFMMHEFGHIKQYRRWGARAYWDIIGPESFKSAWLNPDNHDNFWTETYANFLASRYFIDVKWDYKKWLVQDISDENILRLIKAGY